MKTYIAASFDRINEADEIAMKIDNVISTWHQVDTEYQPENTARAYRDAMQINICDRLIMLIGDEGGCNRFWEFGYAVGLGKEVILIGEFDNCIFERMGFTQFESVEVFLERERFSSTSN